MEKKTRQQKKVKGYIDAKEVCRRLNINMKTLDVWYEWYEDPKYKKPPYCPKLPTPKIVDGRGRRMWSAQSVKTLKKFQAWIPKGRGGVMAEVNQKHSSKSVRAKKEEIRQREEYRKGIKLRDETHHIINAFGETLCGRDGLKIKYAEMPKHKGKVKVCHWCLKVLNIDGKEFNNGVRKIRSDSEYKPKILKQLKK